MIDLEVTNQRLRCLLEEAAARFDLSRVRSLERPDIYVGPYDKSGLEPVPLSEDGCARIEEDFRTWLAKVSRLVLAASIVEGYPRVLKRDSDSHLIWILKGKMRPANSAVR